jgi:hypothetical protein
MSRSRNKSSGTAQKEKARLQVQRYAAADKKFPGWLRV